VARSRSPLTSFYRTLRTQSHFPGPRRPVKAFRSDHVTVHKAMNVPRKSAEKLEEISGHFKSVLAHDVSVCRFGVPIWHAFPGVKSAALGFAGG
jgi:hypothetical protein